MKVGDTFDAKKDVTAKDNEEGDLTDKIEVVENNVDTSKAGTYKVTYKVSDKDGATRTKTITVTVYPKPAKMNHIPTIDAEDVTLTVGDQFNAKKDVTAKDDEDGDLTDKIEVIKNEVDTSTPGSYQVTYRVKDSQGAIRTKTITVTVNPKMETLNWAPVIDANDRVLTVGDAFDPMEGVSASDHEDGDLTSTVIIVSSNVDTSTAGTYQVTYQVTDSQGAGCTKTITVTVNPKMETLNWAPVIDANDRVLTVGDAFDPMEGVSASDHEDGDLTSSVIVASSNVDTSQAGTYQVTYQVTDSQGAGYTKTINVTVYPKMEVLNQIPEIKAEDKTIIEGDDFNALEGVTASDHEDGDITNRIVVKTNNVDTNKPGIYEVIYEVTDSQGATALKTIQVTVQEKDYEVDYEFKSRTVDRDLPQEILDLEPEDDGEYELGRTIKARKPSKTEVKTDEGVWKFVGYDEDSETANDENLDTDGKISFVGYWEFKPNSKSEPSTKENEPTMKNNDSEKEKGTITNAPARNTDSTRSTRNNSKTVSKTPTGTYTGAYVSLGSLIASLAGIALIFKKKNK